VSTYRRHNQDSDVDTALLTLSSDNAGNVPKRVYAEFLGFDLGRAFDIIRRDKLLDILQTFSANDLCTTRCHFAIAAPTNWRVSFIHDNHRHPGRRQPQPGIIYRNPRSDTL